MAKVVGAVVICALLACGGAQSGRGERSKVILEGTSLLLVNGDDESVPIEIHFRVDSSVLEDQSLAALGVLAGFVSAHTELKRVEVRGYSDQRGTEEHNLDLSRRRATSVMKALVERGVAAARLRAKGFGSTHPVAVGATEEAWRKNRRVEFVIVDP